MADRGADQTTVSMEPQIGIRGRTRSSGKCRTAAFVSMEPQIGIQGRAFDQTMNSWFVQLCRFNGAPDRNPGKDDHAAMSEPLGIDEVSMESQIGIVEGQWICYQR